MDTSDKLAIAQSQWSQYEQENQTKLVMCQTKLVKWAITQLLQDLPKKRDWLNPDIERILKDFVK